jgi:biopolymer transport protein ExbD
MLSSPPPEKHRPLVSRGLAIALIAISLVVVASAVYLRHSADTVEAELRKPQPALTPEQIASAKAFASQLLTEDQKREHAFGLVITNGRVQKAGAPPRSASPDILQYAVTTIRRLVSPTPNIMILDKVGELPLTNINLNWPSPTPNQLEAVLKALADSTGGKFTVTVERNDNAGRGFSINSHGPGGILSAQSGPGPVYVLAPAARTEAMNPRRVAVFNLAALPPENLEKKLADARARRTYLATEYGPQWPPLIELNDQIRQLEQEAQNRGYKIEGVLRETLNRLGMETADFPSLRYHRDTGLLVATGTEAALEILGKIVTALGGTSGPVTTATDTPPQAAPTGGTAIATKRVVLTVTADHALRWNGQPVRVEELQERLQALKQAAALGIGAVDFEIETPKPLRNDTITFVKSLAKEIEKAGIAIGPVSPKYLSDSPPPAAPPKR